MSPPSPLWNHPETMMQPCSAHERRVLLLDYDGTLTSIASYLNAARAHLDRGRSCHAS
jgi:trehalose-6-phosphatase